MLDIVDRCGNNYYMPRQKNNSTMTDLLRQAIAESKSFRAIETATGVKRQSLMKFVLGEQSLRLDKADKLAEYFRIEVKKRK